MTTALSLLEAGYTELISVIPPNARISPNSAIPNEARGKVPGRPNGDGSWHGHNWRNSPAPSPDELAQWEQQGANIGLRADYFPGIDIDSVDAILTELILQRIKMYLGDSLPRVGQPPRCLVPCQTNAPFRRLRLWIGEEHLVEVLGAGQQYVVAGMHPGTKKAYYWPEGITQHSDLPYIDSSLAEEFMTNLQGELEMLGWNCRREGAGEPEIDRSTINQDALVGDYEDIKEAIELMSNDNDVFPGRDDYLRLGYAIKAAVGEAGWPLFLDWALKWEGNSHYGGNNEETVRADWGRMKSPFGVGAQYIYQLAQKWGFNYAGEEFYGKDYIPRHNAVLPGPATGGSVSPGSNPSDGSSSVPFASDFDLAMKLYTQHNAMLRYNTQSGTWYEWQGYKWASGSKVKAEWRAMTLCNSLIERVTEVTAHPSKIDTLTTRLASFSTAEVTVKTAARFPAMQVEMDDMDSNVSEINTPHGLVNLKTGELYPAKPSHLVSKATAVPPDFDNPPVRWLQFLKEATAGDVQLQHFLQKLSGYYLSGYRHMPIVVFLYGPGGNGKSIFIDTIRGMMGEYGRASPMRTFTASIKEDHPTEIANLVGARLVTAQETKGGQKWDDDRVKSLTGDDEISARFMQQDYFTFRPYFKLLFSGNRKPSVERLDEALRRRLCIVPFTNRPKKKDDWLMDTLRDNEWPGILAWAIKGCQMVLDEGLEFPSVVEGATAQYFNEEDNVGMWLSEHIQYSSGKILPLEIVWADWQQWCNSHNVAIGNRVMLRDDLTNRGYAVTPTTNGVYEVHHILLMHSHPADFS